MMKQDTELNIILEAKMNIQINDSLSIRGETYGVIGIITYCNPADNCVWQEYRLINHSDRREKWLSIDEHYREYSISEMVRYTSVPGYHLVDKGTQRVAGSKGNVDVDPGECAYFEEYEDQTEEYIFSVERWSDGTEYSTGYYLEPEEIINLGNIGQHTASPSGKKGCSAGCIAVMAVMLLPFILTAVGLGVLNFSSGIDKYLSDSVNYSYVTSVTGKEKQKANVYSTSYSVDEAAKDIINKIEGKTEGVQQNTEDGDSSIGIMTKKEYCLVYTSEEGGTLVQVSNRKYAYYNDSTPYHSRRHTHRYYRRFYYTMAYTKDSSRYRSGTSPYSSYDDTSLDTSISDAYKSYSSSIRQNSINTRSSSGGGTNFGK